MKTGDVSGDIETTSKVIDLMAALKEALARPDNLSDCDRGVVERYLRAGGRREGAALYCSQCHHRIAFVDGVWRAQ